MNATAAYRPRSPIDDTAPFHPDDRGGPVDPFAMPDDLPRPTAGRFAFTCGDRPLEGYTIKRAVGRGGFGEVYYAVSDSGKEVALKLILRNLDVERRGVVQCMNLKHPNLLTIFDLRSNDGGDVFVVMEYVAGPSLAEVLRRHPSGLPADEVRHWLKGLVDGVAYLHDHGVVHRDLKPANLFMEEGVVKIGDYGLAKLITASHGSEHSESIGTCHYMAPEIGSGKYHRPIDVYAVGVILYEMLCGRVPFDGETVNEILMKHLTARPEVSPLPETYRGIVSKALAKDPNQRPSHVYDLLLPADAPRTPEIRIIGSPGSLDAPQPEPTEEEIHRIEPEEPIFYIGPDTMPPRPSPPERLKADWGRRRRARTARTAGFARAFDDGEAGARPREDRRPEAPPPRPTGRARLAEVTASMLWAALLIGLLMAPAVGLLGIDPARDGARIVFLYGVALLATWAALALDKVLEAREIDPAGRRAAAALAGAAVGVGGWLLAHELMLDDFEIATTSIYFAGLFAITSAWYGQTVRDRKRRFRLVPMAGTLLATALLLPGFWGVGDPIAGSLEGSTVAAIVAASIQLASPWNEKAARYAEYEKRLDKAARRTRTA